MNEKNTTQTLIPGGSHVAPTPLNPLRLEKIPHDQAAVFMPAAFQAAAPEADAKGNKWQMELYKAGYVFAGHWRWGDIVIDLQGIKPTRQDVFALYNHWRDEVAGFTSFIGVESGRLIARGQFLEGTKEDEPIAYKIKSRMAQKAPMQCSGGFVPRKVEILEAGASAVVDGVMQQGPKTIFRETDVIEASFCEMGWYQESQAKLAASAGKDAGAQPIYEIAVIAASPQGQTPNRKGSTMTKEEKASFLASLKDIFGADKALELFAANPQADKLEAFAGDMIPVIQSLRAETAQLTAKLAEKETALQAKAGEITQLQADLKAAKARPAVVTAGGDNPEGGKPPAKGTPADLKARWDNNEDDVQAEFSSYEAYALYMERYGEEE